MASLQSNSTFSVEHHLTGEAFLAWYLHIVRTSTIAKNRHLNIVLRAELYLRTGTYDRPKNTLAIDSAYPARLCPGDRCARRRFAACMHALNEGWTIDMTVGEKSVNPLRDEASPLLSGNKNQEQTQ